MKLKIQNFLIRFGAMSIRLLFLTFLGRETTEYALGEYSLIASSISVGLIVIGFDLYVNSTREILAKPVKDHPNILYNQVIANIPVYIVLLPMIYGIFYFDIISTKYILLFYILIIIEHIGSEMFRHFITIEKAILANTLFFIRNASWGLIIIILYYGNQIELTISTILYTWIFMSLVSVIIGGYKILKIYNFNDVVVETLLIKQAYSVSVKFFTGTIAYKAIEFSDRYFLNAYLGKDIVGIYSLYGQFGSVLNTIIYTVVITLLYPRLLSSIYDNNYKLFIDTKKKMLTEVLIISVMALIGGIIFLEPVLNLIGKDSFIESKNLFYLFLLSNLIFNISYVYHFIITGYKHDNFLMIVTLLGGGLDLLLNIVLIPILGMLGAVIAKIAAFSLILILKYTYATSRRLSPKSIKFE